MPPVTCRCAYRPENRFAYALGSACGAAALGVGGRRRIGDPLFLARRGGRQNGSRTFPLTGLEEKSEEEALQAGVEDCLIQAVRQGMYCFVEWPEKAAGLLTMPCLRVNIETVSEMVRMLNCTMA